MMGKRQQIEELTARLHALEERAASLEEEKQALTARLSAGSEAGRGEDDAIGNDLFTQRAVDRVKEMIADALLKADRIYQEADKEVAEAKELARLEAQSIREAAQAEAKAVRDNIQTEAQSLKMTAQAEAQALRERAQAEAQSIVSAASSGVSMGQERVARSLDQLSRDHRTMQGDIRRQSMILMDAVQRTAADVMRESADTERCRELLNENLLLALRDNRRDGDGGDGAQALGSVVINSVAEFEALGSYGFRNNALVTRVTVPEGVTAIPDSFFFGCSSLVEAVLPESVTSIGSYAFFGCEGLVMNYLPPRLESIGEYAFSGCGAVRSMRVPASVRSIGVAAFRGCAALERLSFTEPSALQQLGSHVFQNCPSLRELALPEGIDALPVSLFFGCSALESMKIPGKVAVMEADVFRHCDSLRTLEIENGEMLLKPGATEGLQDTRLSLRGESFAWRQIDEPVTVAELVYGRRSPEPQKQAAAEEPFVEEPSVEALPREISEELWRQTTGAATVQTPGEISEETAETQSSALAEGMI